MEMTNLTPRSTVFKDILAILLLLVTHTSSQYLTSSNFEEYGRSTSCPGEVIKYTCNISSYVHLWKVGNISMGEVRNGDINQTKYLQPGNFTLDVINIGTNMDQLIVNITSMLTIIASPQLNGTLISCEDGLNTMSNPSSLRVMLPDLSAHIRDLEQVSLTEVLVHVQTASRESCIGQFLVGIKAISCHDDESIDLEQWSRIVRNETSPILINSLDVCNNNYSFNVSFETEGFNQGYSDSTILFPKFVAINQLTDVIYDGKYLRWKIPPNLPLNCTLSLYTVTIDGKNVMTTNDTRIIVGKYDPVCRNVYATITPSIPCGDHLHHTSYQASLNPQHSRICATVILVPIIILFMVIITVFLILFFWKCLRVKKKMSLRQHQNTYKLQGTGTFEPIEKIYFKKYKVNRNEEMMAFAERKIKHFLNLQSNGYYEFVNGESIPADVQVLLMDKNGGLFKGSGVCQFIESLRDDQGAAAGITLPRNSKIYIQCQYMTLNSLLKRRSQFIYYTPLEEIPFTSYKFYPVEKTMDMKEFLSSQSMTSHPPFSGCWYNEFTTAEFIKLDKQVILQDCKEGKLFTGPYARQYILATNEKQKVHPPKKDASTWKKVYIQCKLDNWTLKSGMTVLHCTYKYGSVQENSDSAVTV